MIAFNAGDTLNLNEGDALTLDASNSFTEDDIGLGYRWTQASGPTLLPQSVLSEAFTFTVREDLLSADANRGEVVLIMEIIEKVASNELASVNVTLAIAKTNEGGVIKIDPINELRAFCFRNQRSRRRTPYRHQLSNGSSKMELFGRILPMRIKQFIGAFLAAIRIFGW